MKYMCKRFSVMIISLSLIHICQKAERFDTVIDPAQIAEVALGYQA